MKKATVNHLVKHLNPSSRVLMRVDFNVPIKDKQVVDLNRIKSTPLFTKAPSPPSRNYSTTIPNLLFFLVTKVGLTVKGTCDTRYVLLLSPLKDFWEDLSDSWKIVWEIRSKKK